MRNFLDLVSFEYKKIFIRKGAVTALIIVTLMAIAMPMLVLAVEGVYENLKKDREYERAMAGMSINEGLISEMKEAYSKIPATDQYTLTSEYEQYARPYSKIYRLLANVFGDVQAVQNLTAEDIQNFYRIRHDVMVGEINALNISDKSKEKLIELDSSIETPFTFDYTEGYEGFISLIYTISIFATFALAICIAPMFSGEYGTRTDQLILTSKLGKNKLISAKLYTAVSLCILFCLLLMVIVFTLCGVIMGFDGADAPFQLHWFYNPYPLTMQQAAIIFSVCIIFSTILTSAITLLLSSVFKSPFGVIIINTVLLFIPMFASIPERYTLFYNLFRLLPVNMLHIGSVLSYVPYEIFGQTILPYIFLPAFAIVASGIMLPFAWRAFKNHQIG